ncbi:hypothetical protein AY498_08330 [Corynebacterium ulcerans]|nr:hypothetical protein AY498_08330 [Corynebacterium ulcerans]
MQSAIVFQSHMRGGMIHPITNDVHTFGMHSEPDEFILAGLRDRDIAQRLMQPRRYLRFQKPADLGQELSCHWPLLTMAMVSEQDGGLAGKQCSKEGNSVLGIHYNVNSTHSAQPQASSDHPQCGFRIHPKLAAAARKPHTLAHAAAGSICIRRCTEDDLVSVACTIFRNPFEVTFTPATLRMRRITPT